MCNIGGGGRVDSGGGCWEVGAGSRAGEVTVSGQHRCTMVGNTAVAPSLRFAAPGCSPVGIVVRFLLCYVAFTAPLSVVVQHLFAFGDRCDVFCGGSATSPGELPS